MTALRKLQCWWIQLLLHNECVIYQAHADRGYPVPYGACFDCLPRIQKLRSMSFPPAKVIP